jgi:hypothetical protein
MTTVAEYAAALYRLAGLEVSEQDLALVELVHDGFLGQLAVLDSADPARFPFEPVDPSGPPAASPSPSPSPSPA